MAAQDPNGHLKKTPTALTNPAMQSPCFIHSHLDKNFALGVWKLKQDHQGVAKSLQHPAQPASPESYASSFAASALEDIEDEYTSSLTTRLAETAVGVREMSKQLGAYLGK
jgi:NAD+ kinase